SADIDGVMMIAIQQLVRENEKLKQTNENLLSQVETLQLKNEKVEEQLETISSENRYSENRQAELEGEIAALKKWQQENTRLLEKLKAVFDQSPEMSGERIANKHP